MPSAASCDITGALARAGQNKRTTRHYPVSGRAQGCHGRARGLGEGRSLGAAEAGCVQHGGPGRLQLGRTRIPAHGAGAACCSGVSCVPPYFCLRRALHSALSASGRVRHITGSQKFNSGTWAAELLGRQG